MEQDLEQQPAVQPAAAQPAVEPAPSPPAALERQVDLAYVAQLENFARQQQAELNRLEPLKDDLAWMLEDETRLDGVRRYRKSYDEASKPQFDPTVEPVVEFVKNEMAPVRAYITRQEQAEAARAKAESDKFNDDNMRYLARITAEHKLSPEQQMKVAAYADSAAQRLRRNVPIEEAWKDMTGSWGGPKTEAAKAPVLRGDAGEIGVPGPSTNDDKVWLREGGLHQYITGKIAEARKTA